MDYKIGDKILYPMHGAGVIEAIEKKTILGEEHSYYVMKLPATDLKVMIPMTNATQIGVRDIISKSEAQKVIGDFKKNRVEEETNWNKRYRDNMGKLRTGDIYDVLDVVKSLMYREKSRGLSTGERKMLTSSKQILVSELVLAEAGAQSGIEDLLEEAVMEELNAG